MPLAKPPVFLADFMLHKLCRWLRLLGVKCEMLTQEVGDDELIRQAMRLKAVLLTRDEELHAKAGNYVKCALVPSTKLVEQVAFVVRSFKLKSGKFPSKSLCPACGGKLAKISKKKVKQKVFPRVYERQKAFWQCSSCGALYWRGSHWDRIIETGAAIGAELARGKK